MSLSPPNVCYICLMDDGAARKLPIRSIEWEITTRCNYSCDYCIQKTYLRLHSEHTSDEVIRSVSRLIGGEGERWLVKLMGGEPFLHPQFLEIVRMIRGGGNNLCTTTNFSVPLRVLERFVDVSGDGLAYVGASFHPGQVRSTEEFIGKAREFQKMKRAGTNFVVTAVGVGKHEGPLRALAHACETAGIPLEISPYKVRAKYVRYPDNDFWKFISPRLLSRSDEIRGKSVFGTVCHAGRLFGRITVEGDVLRCYNLQPGFYLGNLVDGSFEWLPKTRPCLAAKCTCTVPVERNQVEFGNRLPWTTSAAHYVSAVLTDSPKTIGFASKWVARFARYASRHPMEQFFRQ